MASTIEAQGAIEETRLAEAFDRLDSDDSGYISKENLRELLGDEFPQTEIDAIIDESDLTRDGRISYFEFLAQWENHCEAKRSETLHSLSSVSMSPPLSPLSHSERDSSDSTRTDELDVDVVGRATFLENKQLSERKVASAHCIPIEAVTQHDYDKSQFGWSNLEPVYGN